MKVTVVCANMENNALGRALLLAQLAERLGHEVQVVGVAREGGQVWAPARDEAGSIALRTLPMQHAGHYPRALRQLRAMTQGSDLVIVSKPLPTSMGLVMASGLSLRRTILDIDDWDLGFVMPRAGRLRGARMVYDLVRPRRLNSYSARWVLDQITAKFPYRVVSNHWLQARFGGELLPHVRDGAALDPAQTSGDAMRAALNLSNERLWVGFVGTPRQHKGVDVLIDALAKLTSPDAPGLVLLGADPADPLSSALIARGREALGEARFRSEGFFPWQEIAARVAAIDIIAIPSLEHVASQGQIPAKVFDALAMARPTVVSDVNDLAQVVGDAGEVVPPGDVDALSSALDALARDPARRARLSEAARERFLARYSFEAGMQVLERVMASAMRS